MAPSPSPSEDGALLFETEDGEVRFTVRPGECVLVGRRDADVLIANVTVGRRHARLDYRTGTCLLEDAGSPGGTWLNNMRVRGPEPISPGDRISIGQLILGVRRL